jgi:hypothetical protein
MRVTFDTNALADVVAPATSQRPNGATDGTKVRAAIRAGTVQGFFCETMITLEGIKNVDRSAVFGSTTTNTTTRRRSRRKRHHVHQHARRTDVPATS